MNDAAFERNLKTANIEEINIAISRIEDRKTDVDNFISCAKENKDYSRLRVLQTESFKLIRWLDMLRKKKSELES